MSSGAGHFGNIEISTGSVLETKFYNEDEIIGYVEPWIASPGQEVAVKVIFQPDELLTIVSYIG